MERIITIQLIAGLDNFDAKIACYFYDNYPEVRPLGSHKLRYILRNEAEAHFLRFPHSMRWEWHCKEHKALAVLRKHLKKPQA